MDVSFFAYVEEMVLTSPMKLLLGINLMGRIL